MPDSIDEILQKLTEAGLKFQTPASLKKYNSFCIETMARILVFPETIEQCILLQDLLLKKQVPFFLLGGGSNVILPDGVFDGIMVKIDFPQNLTVLSKTEDLLRIRVPASVRSAWFAKQVSSLGFAGLEFLSTIPGCLGGAIVQNAGCFGSEIKDSLESVTILQDGKKRTITKDECSLQYRNSIFKENKNLWILSAVFALKGGDQIQIDQNLSEFQEKRRLSQPRNRKSAGSIFKNPDPSKTPLKAWELIDKAGLKGITVNDAKIAEEHCNFIINTNKAASADIKELIERVLFEVEKTFNIRLETEVEIVSEVIKKPEVNQ